MVPCTVAVFVVPIVCGEDGDGFVCGGDGNGNVFVKAFGYLGPPLFIGIAQFGYGFGMLVGNVMALFAVLVHVVEFFAIDESPTVGHGCTFAPFLRVFNAL